MSSLANIPGFYFDTERRKYFRIQPNHRAPDGAVHSRSAVSAKSQAEKAESDVRIRHIRQENGSIHRLHRSTFTNLELNLRSGDHSQRTIETLAHYYAASLRCRSLHLGDHERTDSFTLSNDGNLYCTIYQRRGIFRILQLNSNVKIMGDVQMNVPPHCATQMQVYGDDSFAMFAGTFFTYVIVVLSWHRSINEYSKQIRILTTGHHRSQVGRM